MNKAESRKQKAEIGQRPQVQAETRCVSDFCSLLSRFLLFTFALLAFDCPAQTSVQFWFTNVAIPNWAPRVTIIPSADTALQTNGFYVVASTPVTRQPTNGSFIVPLWTGNYTVKIEGMPISFTIAVPNTNIVVNASTLTTNLLTYLWTNAPNGLISAHWVPGWGLVVATNLPGTAFEWLSVGLDPSVVAAGSQTPWNQPINANQQPVSNLNWLSLSNGTTVAASDNTFGQGLRFYPSPYWLGRAVGSFGWQDNGTGSLNSANGDSWFRTDTNDSFMVFDHTGVNLLWSLDTTNDPATHKPRVLMPAGATVVANPIGSAAGLTNFENILPGAILTNGAVPNYVLGWPGGDQPVQFIPIPSAAGGDVGSVANNSFSGSNFFGGETTFGQSPVGPGLGLTNMLSTNVNSVNPSTTILLSLGDSKAVNLFAEMQSDPRFSGYALITNCAVNGSSVADSLTAWTTYGQQVSKSLVNGTNGILIYFGCHNNQDNGYNPMTDIGVISNIFWQATLSNWLVMPLTTQARVPGDKPSGYVYIDVMDNWLRQCPFAWRVSDAYQFEPNCYNTNYYPDGTHAPPNVISNNEAKDVLNQIALPYKIIPPQQHSFTYGTNWITIAPGASNTMPTFASAQAMNQWLVNLGGQPALNLGHARQTSVGANALLDYSLGASDVAVGWYALGYNLGSYNVGVGNQSAWLGTGSRVVAIGHDALYSLTSGSDDTAVGYYSGFSQTTANQNTSLGSLALENDTTGNNNVSVGYQSMMNSLDAQNDVAVGALSLTGNTHGSGNVGVGASTLQSNTTGNDNTGTGYNALQSNTTGSGNTAVGQNTLTLMVSGSGNTAVGKWALQDSTADSDQTAVGNSALELANGAARDAAFGAYALLKDTTGSDNTAIGASAEEQNTIGSQNTAIGSLSMPVNTIGGGNVAVGYSALYNHLNGANNIAIGEGAGPSVGTNGSFLNITIGNGADVGGSFNRTIELGNGAVATNSDESVLGGTNTTLTVIPGTLANTNIIGSQITVSNLFLSGTGPSLSMTTPFGVDRINDTGSGLTFVSWSSVGLYAGSSQFLFSKYGGLVVPGQIYANGLALTNIPITGLQTNGFAPLQVLGMASDGSGFVPLTRSGGGSGGPVVSSVGLSIPGFTITGSPVTGSGTLTATPNGPVLTNYESAATSLTNPANTFVGFATNPAGQSYASLGAATNAAAAGTNGLGSAAWSPASAFDPSSTALNATNGAASWPSTTATQNATNGLNSSEITSKIGLGVYDPSGTAVIAVQNATNTAATVWPTDLASQNATNGLNSAEIAAKIGSGVYDTSGAAQNATNPLSRLAYSTFGGTNYYVAAGTSVTVGTNVSGSNVTWTVNSTGGGGGGGGTVTSVGFTAPGTGLTPGGSPVTSSGTLTLSAPSAVLTNGSTLLLTNAGTGGSNIFAAPISAPGISYFDSLNTTNLNVTTNYSTNIFAEIIQGTFSNANFAGFQTNLWGTGGIGDTNISTGSYSKIRGGWFILTNAQTGSLEWATNASILLSNGITGLTIVLTNGGATLQTLNLPTLASTAALAVNGSGQVVAAAGFDPAGAAQWATNTAATTWPTDLPSQNATNGLNSAQITAKIGAGIYDAGGAAQNATNPLSRLAYSLFGGTNYYLAPGTSVTTSTNVSGSNVTWTVNSTASGSGNATALQVNAASAGAVYLGGFGALSGYQSFYAPAGGTFTMDLLNGIMYGGTFNGSFVGNVTGNASGSAGSVAIANVTTPGQIPTNGITTVFTFSNNLAVDLGHQFSGNIAGLTNASGQSIPTIATNAAAAATNGAASWPSTTASQNATNGAASWASTTASQNATNGAASWSSTTASQNATNGAAAWASTTASQNATNALNATAFTGVAGSVAIANVTTPGQIPTNGVSTAFTFSNSVTTTGSLTAKSIIGSPINAITPNAAFAWDTSYGLTTFSTNGIVGISGLANLATGGYFAMNITDSAAGSKAVTLPAGAVVWWYGTNVSSSGATVYMTNWCKLCGEYDGVTTNIYVLAR
jgi:hypothetical protein